ncbi:MAG: FAD-dependent oxidoreductase [Spirochaetaceae bacterium]|nr:FAD-dependent oxidoreductase [Spirochaetaceae bacterium]
MVNPFTAREGTTRPAKTEQPKNIMVVGGGPAGLVASWIAAERGHNVTCYEKTGKLGGEFRLASHPPTKGNIASLIGNYITIARNRGVQFIMNTEVTPELVRSEGPDAVILCTGSIPLIPTIEGLRVSSTTSGELKAGNKLKVGQMAGHNVDGQEPAAMDIVMARDVLDGRLLIGQKILVIGGGSVGAETADYVARSYREVTIIEMRGEIGLDEEAVPRIFLMERLSKNGVQFVTDATVKRFTAAGVVYEKNGTEHTLEGFDTAILALGTQAYNPLEDKIKGTVKEVHVIGDALKARKVYEAIDEASAVALKI